MWESSWPKIQVVPLPSIRNKSNFRPALPTKHYFINIDSFLTKICMWNIYIRMQINVTFSIFRWFFDFFFFNLFVLRIPFKTETVVSFSVARMSVCLFDCPTIVARKLIKIPTWNLQLSYIYSFSPTSEIELMF